MKKNAGDKIQITGSVEITAVWEYTKYTVSFDADGGKGTMADVEWTNENVYTLPENEFTYAHKYFAGWLVNGVEKHEGDEITITADTTITAIWEDIIYVIALDGAGATGSMTVDGQIYGSEYVLPENEFTYTHKNFIGWRVGGVLKHVGETITITDDTTITAVWVDAVYTITLDGAGATGSMTADGQMAGTTYVLPENKFTYAHKTFAGWSVNGGELQAAGEEITIDGETIITAVWEDVEYKVSFNANGGNGTMAGDTAIAGDYTLPENEFTAPEGMIFKGWATTADGAVIESATYAIAGDVTFYAIWLSVLPVQPDVDYTALDEAIANAEALVEADYTEATWYALQSALTVAKAAKLVADQTVIDEAVELLKLAVEALEKAPEQDDENETDAPAKPDATEEATAPTDGSTTVEKEGGCGGAIGGAAVILAAVAALGAGITFRKKED